MGYLAGISAVEHESAAADGLLALPLDGRRNHVHYTHVRTKGASDVQPHQLSRDQFWEHLVRCYREAYPQADSDTGSILMFGIVCKEKHNDAQRDVDRSEHHHAAVYCAKKHFWRCVRKVSAAKYNIHLNAVAHDAYATMYNYLRRPSKKKPLHELDATPYHSPLHPQGDQLRDLIAQGERFIGVRRGKDVASSAGTAARSQFGIAYQWVIAHGLRKRKGAIQLEMDAVKELAQGRPQLLEFVKKHRTSLEDQLAFCWSLQEAPERLARMTHTRLDLLLAAAAPDKACANHDYRCSTTYNMILFHQRVSALDFCHVMYTALEQGRCKGGAVMLVGGNDTGKTTVTEPARLIYATMKTPQSDSFCPLENIRGHELILWQDFRYSPGHPRPSEQGLRIDEGTWNRLLEGLPTMIGVPKNGSGRTDFTYEEDAPMIFTGPFELLAYRNGVVDRRETEQLTCRLQYIYFQQPVCKTLNRKFKHCPTCWSRWVLSGELQWRSMRGIMGDDFTRKVATVLGDTPAALAPAGRDRASSSGAQSSGLAQGPAPLVGSTSSQTMDDVARAVQWRQQGLLSEAEFQAAKRALGLH